ncbi:glycosyltransferase family 2 protein [Flavobacterium sp. N3904]|uniref:glycosyltransferase family 2 protein n=1 Tax=Flavobacterium sp. N3904 TaxID=2986835 RepID=UPI002223F9C9|nr:galactosyltransferase-related protein [Flavobacterium sp. N3904]
MITLVLTNRNRDLQTIKKCLDSLKHQTNQNFELFFVDYGSDFEYVKGLKLLLLEYSKIIFINCPVSGQLWNKSRAINIALRQSNTPYFIVGDVDMLFRDDFIEKNHILKSEQKAIYFKVGFLSKVESQKTKRFENYVVNHYSTKEATGITLYPTFLLKQINGYDEFYHGWGAEDTDVHIRLQNAGSDVEFYEEEVLLLHQWHAKTYRSTKSKQPFHFNLEKINQRYLQQTKKIEVVKANLGFEWGLVPDKEAYSELNSPCEIVEITNEIFEVEAFLKGSMMKYKGKTVCFEIKKHLLNKDFKNKLKKWLGKKYLAFYTLEQINNDILGTLIMQYRNQPYQYAFSQETESIVLKIKL